MFGKSKSSILPRSLANCRAIAQFMVLKFLFSSNTEVVSCTVDKRLSPCMMTSSNGNIFRVAGPLCGEFTGHRWLSRTHSVGSPSMVDPQWDIWYWGSKWNLHTVCWSAVGCEWGTTSVYFGITYVCFSLVDFLSLLLSPSTYFKIFYFCQKYHLKDTYKILKKFHVGLKFEWGL